MRLWLLQHSCIIRLALFFFGLEAKRPLRWIGGRKVRWRLGHLADGGRRHSRGRSGGGSCWGLKAPEGGGLVRLRDGLVILAQVSLD